MLSAENVVCYYPPLRLTDSERKK